MHTVFTPGKAPENYNYEETCPHCDASVPVLIDEQEHTCYKVVCPVCGQKIMLCTLCHWDDEESDCPQGCNWSPSCGCHRDVFTIDTYPPMFSDYENYIENEDYDNTVLYFSVPKNWAIDWITRDGQELDDFMDNYTWDWTYQMYEDATAEKVILSERIKER